MSLISNTETPFTFAELRQRIIADFRDTRFTPLGAARWTGTVIMAFLVAALIMLYFLDWNEMRGPIGRYASARTGREVRIDGDLKVDLFRWQPHVEINKLYVGNPKWVTKPPGIPIKQAAAVKQAVVEFRLWPAIFGNLILPLVRLDQPDALVVRDPTGRTNWDSSKTGAAASWHIPPINRFLVKDGHLEIDDQIRKLKFLGTISSEEQAGKPGSNAFQLTGDGTLNGNKFVADVHGGPLINVDESKPYAFAADITAGDTHAVIDGSVTHPFNLDQFNATIAFTGHNLSDLYYLTGLPMPQTPPYHITAQLTRDAALYRLRNLAGTVGASDLHGELTVDVTGTRPLLRGSLNSRVLDFSDLGSLFGGGKVAAPSASLLPDTALHTERLRQMDADITYAADSIRSQDFPLRGLATHVVLTNGVLDLNPLSFGFSAGKLSGSLKIDARNDVPVTSVDAKVTDLKMENFIKGADKQISGTAEARAVLTGRGNSVHKVAASASGTATAVIPSGKFRKSLAEWLGIDVINALSLTLANDNSETGLRCAVAHFGAKDGVLTSQQFVFDTDPVLVQGSGTVDLGKETMDLRLQGQPKHFQIFRLRAPITVSGSLQHPAIGVDPGPAAVQGAIGLGLGAVNPLAAILAFVDLGLAKNADCTGLMTTAKAQGTPVKPAAATPKDAPALGKK
jgi:uncharacterized protein involved in outer membrane biogenesis